MPQAIRKWNSMSEFVEHVSGPSDEPDYRRMSQRNVETFHSCESFDAATRIAFNWPEGVDRVSKIRGRIALAMQRVRKSVVSREAGPGVLAMGKFLAGHPQPYMNLEDDPRAAKGKGKIVRIVFNCCVSAGIDREIIETRGAAVLALVDALEATGRRVEVTVVMGNKGRNQWAADFAVTVKAAQRKLNLNSVAFALVNPDMLRRFMFAAMEREDARFRKAFRVGGAYGHVTDPIESHKGADVYVPGATWGESQWANEDRAAEWVNERLEAQGITIR